jgi:DHA2 family methylenomycin A resistance protein-like MFS transporter
VTCSTITNKKAAERTRSGSLQSILKRAVYVRVPKTGSVLGVALFGSLIGQENTFLFGLRAALIISAALLVGAAGICSFALRGRQVAPGGSLFGRDEN